MDLNNSYWRKFICENLKNKQRLGEAFFDRRCLKEATLSHVIPQPPKFINYQPWRVLTFFSELKSDDQIRQETKLNRLLADIFDVECAFFIHKQDEQNHYLVRAIGDEELQNEIKVTLPIQSKSSPTYDIAVELPKNSDFRKMILDLIQKPINNMEVIDGCPKEDEVQHPFLLILLNKYLILGKNELDTKVERRSHQMRKISAEFSFEDRVLMRDFTRLLSPILKTLLYKDASALLSWLPEMSNGMKIQFTERSAWFDFVTGISKIILKVTGVKIHLSEDAEKNLRVNPTTNEEARGNSCYIPLLAGKDMLGVFEILKKQDVISFEDREKVHIIAIACTFGIMHWKLQQ